MSERAQVKTNSVKQINTPIQDTLIFLPSLRNRSIVFLINRNLFGHQTPPLTLVPSRLHKQPLESILQAPNMEANTKQIPPSEWDRHREAIVELRRLGIILEGEEEIMAIMKRVHGFEAR
jgi:hypothetical protein